MSVSLIQGETTESETGTSTGKTKKKRVVGPARQKYLKGRRSKTTNGTYPSASAALIDDTQPSSSIALVDNDPALDGKEASIESIPSDLASQVATKHQTVLPKGGYVLYVVPLS